MVTGGGIGAPVGGDIIGGIVPGMPAAEDSTGSPRMEGSMAGMLPPPVGVMPSMVAIGIGGTFVYVPGKLPPMEGAVGGGPTVSGNGPEPGMETIVSGI
jgi:hypothetical protein